LEKQDIIISEAFLAHPFQRTFEQGGHQLAGFRLYGELPKLIQQIVQHELLKEGRTAPAEELAYRVALLENEIQRLRMPEVQYVHLPEDIGLWESSGVETYGVVPITKFPRALIVFYSLGLVSTIMFAALIALSSFGTNLLHPFLSLLGLVGGLGWLTTAWTDLLLRKREKCFDSSTSTSTTKANARVAA
jgi:hypothetical protein